MEPIPVSGSSDPASPATNEAGVLVVSSASGLHIDLETGSVVIDVSTPRIVGASADPSSAAPQADIAEVPATIGVEECDADVVGPPLGDIEAGGAATLDAATGTDATPSGAPQATRVAHGRLQVSRSAPDMRKLPSSDGNRSTSTSASVDDIEAGIVEIGGENADDNGPIPPRPDMRRAHSDPTHNVSPRPQEDAVEGKARPRRGTASALLQVLDLGAMSRRGSGRKEGSPKADTDNNGGSSPSAKLHSMVPEPVFYCGICLENNGVSSGFACSSCSAQHMYCRECMGAYVSVQVREGVTDLMCPHESECGGHATDAEVRSLLSGDPALVEKYLRFKETKANPNMRVCPKCSKWCYGSKERPEMKCEDCDQVFCFLHDMAHANSSCADYAVRVRKEERQTDALVRNTSRPCPSCHAMTTKNGGCNHMTCQQCKTDWCWLCGREMGSGHFDLTNVLGCPGAQFADDSVGIRSYFRCTYMRACGACFGAIFSCLVNLIMAWPHAPFFVALMLSFALGILCGLLTFLLIFIVTLPWYLWILATKRTSSEDSSDPRERDLKDIWNYALVPAYAFAMLSYGLFQFVWLICLIPVLPFAFLYFGIDLCNTDEIFDGDTAVYKFYFYPLYFANMYISVMMDDD